MADSVAGRFMNIRNEGLNDSEPPDFPVKSGSSDGSLLLSALSPDIHCQALQLYLSSSVSAGADTFPLLPFPLLYDVPTY